MRWTGEKSARFQSLREAEARGALSVAKRAELDALLSDLDADEADALRPAMDRMDARVKEMVAEKAHLDAKAHDLERIAHEEDRLLADARVYLERLRERSAALAEDYMRVMRRDPFPAR